MDETSIKAALLLLILHQKTVSAKLREFFKLDNADENSIVKRLEITMTKKDNLFCLNVIPDSEWKEGETIQAYYKHSETSHEIGIKESVYEKACAGQLFAVLIFAHETCHWAFINSSQHCLKKWSSLDEKGRKNLRRMHESFADVMSVILLYREINITYEERRNA